MQYQMEIVEPDSQYAPAEHQPFEQLPYQLLTLINIESTYIFKTHLISLENGSVPLSAFIKVIVLGSRFS